MPRWFNPRVAVVALSIILLVQFSKVGEPRETMVHAGIVCAVLFLLFALAFLLPVYRMLGFRRALGPGLALLAAWVSVLGALIADALPITPAERMERQWNWPMIAFCVAGVIAFSLFFQSATRALAEADDMRIARGGWQD